MSTQTVRRHCPEVHGRHHFLDISCVAALFACRFPITPCYCGFKWSELIFKDRAGSRRRTMAVGLATTARRSPAANGSCEANQGSAAQSGSRRRRRGDPSRRAKWRFGVFPGIRDYKRRTTARVRGCPVPIAAGCGAGEPSKYPSRPRGPGCRPRGFLIEPDLGWMQAGWTGGPKKFNAFPEQSCQSRNGSS